MGTMSISICRGIKIIGIGVGIGVHGDGIVQTVEIAARVRQRGLDRGYRERARPPGAVRAGLPPVGGLRMLDNDEADDKIIAVLKEDPVWADTIDIADLPECMEGYYRILERTLPEVEALHIIAHSRGADVVTAGLRELFIEARGGGIHPLDHFKIRNLVLAAPDLDVSVVSQRLVSEQTVHGIGQFTLYFSPSDKAIAVAERLFASPRGRLGDLDVAQLSAAARTYTERGNVADLMAKRA